MVYASPSSVSVRPIASARAAEMAFPEPVAEDDDVAAAGRVFLRQKHASELRPRTDDVEEAGAEAPATIASALPRPVRVKNWKR